MPVSNWPLPSNVLVQRWRERRREILKSLPAEVGDAIAEYRELGRCIRRVLAEEFRNSCTEEMTTMREALIRQRQEIIRQMAAAVLIPFDPTDKESTFFERLRNLSDRSRALEQEIAGLPIPKESASRTPLSVQKKKLIEFLQRVGPSTRQQMVTEAGIPAGSLSELLNDDEFESVERGLWRLRPPQLPRDPSLPPPPAKRPPLPPGA